MGSTGQRLNKVYLKGAWFGQSLNKISSLLKVEGEKFLKEKMEQIKEKAQQNLTRNKSVIYGDLRDAIETKVYVMDTGYVWAGVGVDRAFRGHKRTLKKGRRKGKTTQQIPTKYAHLVERGFTHLPDGTKIEGKPFLRTAVVQCGNDKGVADELTSHLRNFVNKELKK